MVAQHQKELGRKINEAAAAAAQPKEELLSMEMEMDKRILEDH